MNHPSLRTEAARHRIVLQHYYGRKKNCSSHLILDFIYSRSSKMPTSCKLTQKYIKLNTTWLYVCSDSELQDPLRELFNKLCLTQQIFTKPGYTSVLNSSSLPCKLPRSSIVRSISKEALSEHWILYGFSPTRVEAQQCSKTSQQRPCRAMALQKPHFLAVTVPLSQGFGETFENPLQNFISLNVTINRFTPDHAELWQQSTALGASFPTPSQDLHAPAQIWHQNYWL